MFDITPKIKLGSQQMQRYGGGNFAISNEVYPYSILLSQDKVNEWKHGDELNKNTVQYLCANAADAEIILLGTGERMKFLPPNLQSVFRDAGLSVEVMDTGAACRTYNILLSEERKVMAALMVV